MRYNYNYTKGKWAMIYKAIDDGKYAVILFENDVQVLAYIHTPSITYTDKSRNLMIFMHSRDYYVKIKCRQKRLANMQLTNN